MNETIFKFNSLRAAKSRLGVKLDSKVILFSLIAVTIVGFGGGVTLLITMVSAGWFLLAIGVLGMLLLIWQKYELKNVAPIKNGQRIDELLESPALGRLDKDPSPKELGRVIGQLAGGHFFAARFGVGSAFLEHVASENAADTENVWQVAKNIQQSIGQDSVSAATLTAALIKSVPNVDNFLAQLQLGSEDIFNGADWYSHLMQLIEKHRQRASSGGLARDWSFGYTPLLSRFGLNVSEQVSGGNLLSTELETHQDSLSQLIQSLSGGGRQNAVLVGPLGVGKSTVVQTFAAEIFKDNPAIPSNLRFRQVVALDAATLISNAPGRGQLEQLVNELLMEAYRAKNIIVCLDDAQLFFEEGVGSVNISNVLQPVLDGGGLPIILTMDEQRWLQISQRNPALATTLNRINVGEPSEPETMRVLQDQIIMLEFRHKVTYMYQSLKEAYRLSARYSHEQAMPGKAIKLLEAAASVANNGLVSAASVQEAMEKASGIKVANASDNVERQTLLNLEAKIHERMINQTRAVKVVSDALRRARSGVRNLDRPVGTFLFLGPTGVGKTELAKSLAAVYFGGEEHLIRLDMNELVRPEDVTRLIADGASDPYSLSAQVTKQPFSVVLLDEIEKAHPNVLGTLLQVLDEGILRDANNREVSFRDAIFIATSNAGADIIRAHIQNGENLEQFEAGFIDELINSRQFLPEFLNRFDETVVFRPLNQDELLQVVDLLIAGINKNLALQKIQVTVADDAKQALVQQGYDARLGARPLRRVVQRTIENFIAKQMLTGSVLPGNTITVTLEDIKGE